jgi:hypothetical protein
MELGNHVAERADIDLVGLRVRLEKAYRQRRLFDRSARSSGSMSVASLFFPVIRGIRG